MRITYVAPFGLGKKTTIWARTLPLARQMAAREHEVSIVIPPWDTPQDAGKRSQDGAVSIIQVPVQGGTLAILRRMLREVNLTTPDIVHTIKPRAYAGLVHWWMWQRRRFFDEKPSILLDADDWEQSWSSINDYGWAMSRFLAWQEEWGLRHADGITVASRWLERRASGYSPQTPLLYLPNGIGPSSAPLPNRPPTANDGDNILFFSRFVEVEPDWMSDFCNALFKILPAATLVVAGDAVRPGLSDEYRLAMQEHGMAHPERIRWLGLVDSETLQSLYQKASCAIFPARPTALQSAKCSVRLATTLLAGVPVVASAVGEQSAYGAAGAAELVNAQASPAEFADAVAAVVANPARRQMLSQAARRRLLDDYAWSTLADNLEQFYRQVHNARA